MRVAQTADQIDDLAQTLAFAPDQLQRDLLKSLLAIAQEEGVVLASIAPFYASVASGSIRPATVPAFNVRGLTYGVARAIWRTVRRLEAGPVIFELAPSESRTSRQTYGEYTAMVVAAALREGYRGPVFLQGDHFSLYQGSSEEIQTLKQHCQDAVEAGFYQIDLDASALSDSSADNPTAAQSSNARALAQMIAFIRNLPEGQRVCLGGEVGEIGSRNTRLEDIRAFMQILNDQLSGLAGIQKISIQNGTTHGGLVRPDGSTGLMPIELELTQTLSTIARQELHLSGVVQHGASTLNIEQLSRLPFCGVIEVHLATGIQNRIFDHPAFPLDLLERMKTELAGMLVDAESGRPVEDGELSLQQRFYSARWKAWGQFKRELWSIDEVAQSAFWPQLEDWFADVLRALQIAGRRPELLELYGGS